MAELAAFLPIASTVLNVGSKLMQGDSQDEAAQYQAGQLEQRAGQSRATAQRQALEGRRQARLANSRLQALGGGGGGDPTLVNLSANLTGEGEYRALSSLYEGEERALSDEQQASTLRYQGKQAKRAARIGAIATLFGGSNIGDMFGGAASAPKYDEAGTMFSQTGEQIRGRR